MIAAGNKFKSFPDHFFAAGFHSVAFEIQIEIISAALEENVASFQIQCEKSSIRKTVQFTFNFFYNANFRTPNRCQRTVTFF